MTTFARVGDCGNWTSVAHFGTFKRTTNCPTNERFIKQDLCRTRERVRLRTRKSDFSTLFSYSVKRTTRSLVVGFGRVQFGKGRWERTAAYFSSFSKKRRNYQPRTRHILTMPNYKARFVVGGLNITRRICFSGPSLKPTDIYSPPMIRTFFISR